MAATWVPWTYGLLARDSGYGAGVDSPAWYDQLFDAAEEPVARWLARAARLLREEGLDASAAQVVDADPARGRARRHPGAAAGGPRRAAGRTRAVLCHGSDVPLALVRARTRRGHRLGEVPAETPMVPLQQDVARLQRRLRLKPEAQVKDITLDLRRPNDRERSRLLHRLNLLEVQWGTQTHVSGARHVQRGVPARVAARARARPHPRRPLGHDRRRGGRRRARAVAAREESIAALATLADAVLLADLPDALEDVMRALADRAALDRDTPT